MAKDPGGALAKLMTSTMNAALPSFNVSLPCKVLAFNSGTCKATVQPLLKIGDLTPAPIEAVPVLGHRYRVEIDGVEVEKAHKPVLHVGDLVLVVCADREIKNVLGGQIASPDTDRTHSLNDAVIVGVFPWSL